MAVISLPATPALADIWYQDADYDGYGVTELWVDLPISPGPDWSLVPGDCDDGNAAVHPGAAEIWYDGVDQNCDGLDDYDMDMDGFPLGSDCDDADPTINPGEPEIWYDGIDQDCDGWNDFDMDFDTFVDIDHPAQEGGTSPYGGDCDDADENVFPGAFDFCDALDNDCDGEIDEDAFGGRYYYQDLDGDYYGTLADSVYACEWVPGYTDLLGDCDDADPLVHPGAGEYCNGLDEDCDGVIDEAPTNDGAFRLYVDGDGDGFGLQDIYFCTEQDPVPAGYSLVDGDCNDADASVFPGAPEVCDAVDNDCDWVIDEEVGVTWYPDADQDGYGEDLPQYNQLLCPGDTPENPEHFVTNALDCDNLDPAIHPGVVDVNDWLDNDCDGLIDEDAGTTALVSIRDVGNDQGRYARVRWQRHLYDQPGSPQVLTMYSLYRRIDAWKQGGGRPAAPEKAPPGDWDWVATVPAVGDSIYSLVAHTLCDSTDAGICWSVFFVRSHTGDPFVFFDSPVDSGYSIDNLFPAAPQNLSADYGPTSVVLQWDPSAEDDLRSYRVYRGEGDFPLAAEALLAETAQPSWTDPTASAYGLSYKVTVVDQAGNESAAAAPSEVSGEPQGELPRAWALLAAVPNPFNPATRIRFDVPAPGGVIDLAIYDVTGRRVRTLLHEQRDAGRHEATWRGEDDLGRPVAAGVYVYRLQSRGFAAGRCLTLVR